MLYLVWYLRHRQRQIDQREIVAAQTHEQRADDAGADEAAGNADQNPEVRIGPEIEQVKRRAVGAERQIGRLTEGNGANAAKQKAAADREAKQIADRERDFFELTPRTPKEGAGDYLQQDLLGAAGFTYDDYKKFMAQE